jgi:ABC-type Mn2+/Zn2+ transport system ATPase subunit
MVIANKAQAPLFGLEVNSPMLGTTPAIELIDLRVSYGSVPALSDVCVSIPQGAMVAVIGPNGAGKSTLFKALLGIVPATAGQILVYGQPARRQLSRIAYLPQREELDWRFPVTVLDVVLMGRYGRLGWLRRPGRAEREMARALLDVVGMSQLAQRPIRELSGGQQRRVFLARALVQEPDILILDEPFAGIDNPTQESLLSILSDLPSRGITTLVATHDLSLASSYFGQVMLLNRRLIAFGPPSEVFTAPTLEAAFGSQMLFYRDGQVIIAVADHCCPVDGERQD